MSYDHADPTSRGGRRRDLYRAHDGVFFGVCKGAADYFQLPATGVRILVVAVAVLSGFLPVVVVYAIAAALMKPEPARPLETDEDEEFYNSYAASRTMALDRLKRKFDQLDRRARRMEGIVTAKEFDWEERLNG